MSRYIAKPYISGSPDTQILGSVMNIFFENPDAAVGIPLLAEHGLVDIDPEKWYSYQIWLDVLRHLSEVLGSDEAFISIGRKSVEKAVIPPEVDSIPAMLSLLHDIHDLNVRNLSPGEGYHIEKKGDNHYWEYQNTPNPDELIYGYIWGLVARFKKPNEHFVVRMIPNPDQELHPGTIYEVKWGPQSLPLD